MNDLVYRPKVAKKNRNRMKQGKPLLQMGNPHGPRIKNPKMGTQGIQLTKPPRPRLRPKQPGASGSAGAGKSSPGKSGDKSSMQGDFIRPLTRKQFQNEREADVRLQYDDLERQINREKAASAFRYGTELPSWYSDARNDIAKLTGQQTDTNNALMQRLQDAQTQAGTQDAANRSAMMDRLAKDAALRGSPLDPNVESGQIGAEAARANQSFNVLATLGGQGTNQVNSLLNRSAISHQKEGETRATEAARDRQRDEDLRKLEREKGDFRVKYRQDARKAEREFYLGKKTLGSKNAYSKAIVKQAQLGQNKNVNVHNSYSGLPKHPKNFKFNYGGKGGGSSHGYSVREAIGLARQHARQKSAFPRNRAALVDYLVGRGVDVAVAKKAANRFGV